MYSNIIITRVPSRDEPPTQMLAITSYMVQVGILPFIELYIIICIKFCSNHFKFIYRLIVVLNILRSNASKCSNAFWFIVRQSRNSSCCFTNVFISSKMRAKFSMKWANLQFIRSVIPIYKLYHPLARWV